MHDLTDTELDELEALSIKAAPGPWLADSSDPDDVVICGPEQGHWIANVGDWEEYVQNPSRDICNGQLIAAMRTALPAILEELKRRRSNEAERMEKT